MCIGHYIYIYHISYMQPLCEIAVPGPAPPVASSVPTRLAIGRWRRPGGSVVSQTPPLSQWSRCQRPPAADPNPQQWISIIYPYHIYICDIYIYMICHMLPFAISTGKPSVNRRDRCKWKQGTIWAPWCAMTSPFFVPDSGLYADQHDTKGLIAGLFENACGKVSSCSQPLTWILLQLIHGASDDSQSSPHHCVGFWWFLHFPFCILPSSSHSYLCACVLLGNVWMVC